METTLLYLKKLFISDEALDRQEFGSIFSLLWFLNLFAFVFLPMSHWTSVMVSKMGHEFLGAYTMLNQLQMGFHVPSIPFWVFLILGSFFYMRRLYGRQIHILLQLAGGWCILYFFRGFYLIPMGLYVKVQFSSGRPQMLEWFKPAFRYELWINIILFLLGAILIFFPFFRNIKKKEAASSDPFRLNRNEFLNRQIKLQWIGIGLFAFILAVGYLLYQNYLFQNRFIQILLGLSFLILIIQSTIHYIRRLRDSFLSPWCWGALLLYFKLFVLGVLPFYLMATGHLQSDLIILHWADVFLGILTQLPGVFFLVLALVPSVKPKEPSSKDLKEL